MYQKEDISLNDVFKQFSKWHEAWIHRKKSITGNINIYIWDLVMD